MHKTPLRRYTHYRPLGRAARTDQNGNVNAIQSYDEYGIPCSSNVTRFQYTDQMYLPAIGMHYYKARMYSPTLGRFMQTDPIGYDDGPNWYAYVKNDPVNFKDPMGLKVDTIEDIFNVKPYNPNDAPIDVFGCRYGGRYPNCDRINPITLDSLNNIAEPLARTNERGGGGGGNVSPQNPKPDPCSVVAGQTGQIKFTGKTVSAVLGLGLSRTSGTFTNMRTGSTGHFVSYGVGAGLSVGVSRISGYYDSISNFMGYAETAEAGVSLFGSALSLNAFVTTNANNDVTAAGGGLSLGAPLPLPAWASRVGASATASDTSISQCTVGPRQ